jgi:hypothetical protein
MTVSFSCRMSGCLLADRTTAVTSMSSIERGLKHARSGAPIRAKHNKFHGLLQLVCGCCFVVMAPLLPIRISGVN